MRKLLPFLVLFTSHAVLADDFDTWFRKQADAYRQLVPTAPVSIPGMEDGATPGELELNKKILEHPGKCQFVGNDSGFGRKAKPTTRLKVIRKSDDDFDWNAKQFLKACRQVRKDVGHAGCSVVEIGGHAEGFSIGLGLIFGLDLDDGNWDRYPLDNRYFAAAIACLKDIAAPEAPFVFTTCGAGHVEPDFKVPAMRGLLLYYAYRKEAQQYMTDVLGHEVISALGPENGQQWGDHSRKGWYVSHPERSIDPRDRYTDYLPVPEVQWTREGRPRHYVPNGYDWQHDIDMNP
jgi:hypothetical protein